MKFKLFLSLTFLFFLTASKAQIHYTDEEIKNKYDHETIMLTMDGSEKNGVLSRFNYLIPSQDIREAIEKNGGSQANKEYQTYKKTVGLYWLISIVGIIAILAVGLGALIPATMATYKSAFLLYMLVLFGFTFAISFLGKKAYRELARSVWSHNLNILLKKS